MLAPSMVDTVRGTVVAADGCVPLDKVLCELGAPQAARQGPR